MAVSLCIALALSFSVLICSTAFELKEARKDGTEKLEGLIQQLLRNVEYRDVSSTDLDMSNNSGCACVQYNCGCCAHIEVVKIRLNDTVCANFSYLPTEYGISFTLTIDNRTLINKTISAKNPPAICVGVPYLKEYASVCLQFYNLTKTDHKFRGCVKIEAKLEGILVETYKIGCFSMPLPNDQYIRVEKYKSLKEETFRYKILNSQVISVKSEGRAKMRVGPIGFY